MYKNYLTECIKYYYTSINHITIKKGLKKTEVFQCESCYKKSNVCAKCTRVRNHLEEYCEECKTLRYEVERIKHIFSEWNMKEGCVEPLHSKHKIALFQVCPCCKNINSCYINYIYICFICYFTIRKIVYLEKSSKMDISKLDNDQLELYNLTNYQNQEQFGEIFEFYLNTRDKITPIKELIEKYKN